MKKAKGKGLGFGIYLMMACAGLGALTSTVYGDSRAPHGSVEPTHYGSASPTASYGSAAPVSAPAERSLEEMLLDFSREAYEAYVSQLVQIKAEIDALRAKMDSRTATDADYARMERLTDELKVKNTTLTQMFEILSQVMRDLDQVIERAARSERSASFGSAAGLSATPDRADGSAGGEWDSLLSELRGLQDQTSPQDFEMKDLLRTLIELSQTMNQFATAYSEGLELQVAKQKAYEAMRERIRGA